MFSNPLNTLRGRRRSDEGFTLIELLVVVVILGILIGIAVPVYLNYRKSAQDKAAQSDIRNAISTFEVCNSEAGYPTALTGATPSYTMTGCTTQTLRVSGGTSFKYIPSSAASPVSFIVLSTNSSGSGKVYCYNSQSGGTVITSGVSTTDPATAKPAMDAATACAA